MEPGQDNFESLVNIATHKRLLEEVASEDSDGEGKFTWDFDSEMKLLELAKKYKKSWKQVI